jgi:copper chaperone
VSTQTFHIAGMTCDHCVHAVTEELQQLDGVRDVGVELVPGGISHITVETERTVADAEVAAALDDAGAYVLA